MYAEHPNAVEDSDLPAPDQGVGILVAIPGGLEPSKDISRSAHSLDQDQEVANAWGQGALVTFHGPT